MKKSLLALAVLAMTASANATVVYDKDGTQLYLDGRVMSVFYGPNYNKAGVKDAAITTSGRFGIGGKTQITSWVSGLGYAQWDVANDSNDSHFKARDQWVALDFGQYGLVKMGRYVDATYFVEQLTDYWEDAAGIQQGKFNGERRSSQISYIYDNYGFYGRLGVQFAEDNARVWGMGNALTNKYAVDSGFNLALGYTFDKVWFGPLSIRAGYSYLRGQDEKDTNQANLVFGANSLTVGNVIPAAHGIGFKNFYHVNGGISWGDIHDGFYVALIGEYAKMRQPNLMTDVNVVNKGGEFLVGYAFGNGLEVRTSYQMTFWEFDIGVTGVDKVRVKNKRIPVFINYKFNPHFDVWAECGFNAGSDHNIKVVNNITNNTLLDVDNTYGLAQDKFVWSLGARYTF
jgi:predicted porin